MVRMTRMTRLVMRPPVASAIATVITVLIATIVATGLTGLSGCRRPGAPSSVDANREGAALEQARLLLAERVALPARSDVLATARALEELALHEGAGARASALHATAARLYERLWRVE